MSVDDQFLRDTRVDRLARMCGWSRRETRACLEDIWALCYDRVVPYLPRNDIEDAALRDAIAPPTHAKGFVDALVESGLGRPAKERDRLYEAKNGTLIPFRDDRWRGKIYLAGAAERVGYQLNSKTAGHNGGKKSGEIRRRKREAPLKSERSTLEGGTNPSASALTSDLPSAPASALASARTTESRAQIGDLATATWGQMAQLRLALATELGLTDIAPLTIIGGSEPRGFRDLRARIREEGDRAAMVCDQVLASLAGHARETNSVEWVSDKATTEGGWAFAKNWTARRRPSAARPAHVGRAPIENNTFTDGER